MRIVALLATHNEERFVGPCIENLIRQGLEVYLVDNSSTDQTVLIAERYLDRGLLDIESFPHDGTFRWRSLLARKEELAATLDADWFIHVDADEIRMPPSKSKTLAEAIAEVDDMGFNAVNFQEFTFIPTMEASDHDHPGFQQTMRFYYPFLPWYPHRLNAWKRQDERVSLVESAGHQVSFPNLSMCPRAFPMRHYLFLSVRQAIDKYVSRVYDPQEIKDGWHGPRVSLQPEEIRLPSQARLRFYETDRGLDPSNPRRTHYLFDHAVREG